MKNTRFKTTILAASVAATGACISQGSLILTGLIDGSLAGGAPKAIELYVTSDIPDLSLYGVELVSNAGSSGGATETDFSGSATAGSYLYVATEAPLFTSVFGVAPDFVSGDVNHNGDDDFYIYGPGGVLIDLWSGSDGVDNTGTESDILDTWAYRNNGAGPNTTFTASEWTIAAINALDGLDAAGLDAAVPFGTYASVPEPSAALLGAIGALALLRRRRR